MIEIVIAIFISSIILTIIPRLVGSQDKYKLISARDQLSNVLQMARQESIGARYGEAHGVQIQSDRYIILPENKLYRLPNGVTIVNPMVIMFEKLNGNTTNDYAINLEIATMRVTVKVNRFGITSVTTPELKE